MAHRLAVSPDIEPNPEDVFNGLVTSSAFEPRSSSIEEKRLIFGKVWAEEIPWLRHSFDSAGLNGADYGFGFLVEAFVRRSKKLPRKNTVAGEKAARTIISELHSGDRGEVRLGRRQSNSDFLWVELTGRRITITAIGEIKASYRAASHKVGGQLKRQERSINFLAEKLKSAKTDGSVRGFFQNRGVVVSDELERFLFVPFGEGEKARNDEEFAGWQVVEIEFGYPEMIFIAQQIWPDFRPDIRIGPGKLANLFQVAGNFTEGWTRQRVDQDFGPLGPEPPYFELGLFFLATGKTPLVEDWLLEDGIKWSAELVRESFWPAMQECLNFLINSTARPEIDFSEREKNIFKRFWYVLTPSREDLEYFIYFLRFLNTQIKESAHDRHQFKHLKAMSEIWTI